MENIYHQNEDLNKLLNQGDFISALNLLLHLQKQEWEELRTGYISLDSTNFKKFQFNGFSIKAQHNPGRIKSSSAKVDEKSINNRKCFLCMENLPKNQKGILYDNNFLFLCNPFPIFNKHFTIAYIKHIPQQIFYSFEYLLKISRELKDEFIVFYNGPKCGASAPDHLHFQAGEKGFMPIDDEFHLIKNEYSEILSEDDSLCLTAIDDGLRRFISIESNRYATVVEIFGKIYRLLQNDNSEPLLNILSSYEENYGWRIIIFLREKHRPECYFKNGKDNFLLSPAAVDYGGVCILPLEKDFQSVSEEKLNEVFNETSISAEKFHRLKSKLKNI